jgi:hypothetical protein
MEANRRAAQPPQDDPRAVSATPPSEQVSPSTQAEAPPLPPAIEIPSLPNISEQKPARAPPRAQQRAAPQPRPTPGKPLQLLPASPHD